MLIIRKQNQEIRKLLKLENILVLKYFQHSPLSWSEDINQAQFNNRGLKRRQRKMLLNKPEAQTDHKEAMAAIQDSVTQRSRKSRTRTSLAQYKRYKTRLNQIIQTNNKAIVGEISTETTKWP